MRDPLTLIWVGLAILAGVIEMFTLDLVFLMVAGGALTAAVVAALTGNLAFSVVAFAVATLALLAGARPPLKAYLKNKVPEKPMHTDALIGQRAEVLHEVGSGADGRIKLDGEIWSARTEGISIPVGTFVRVQRIDGATAVVEADTRPLAS